MLKKRLGGGHHLCILPIGFSKCDNHLMAVLSPTNQHCSEHMFMQLLIMHAVNSAYYFIKRIQPMAAVSFHVATFKVANLKMKLPLVLLLSWFSKHSVFVRCARYVISCFLTYNLLVVLVYLNGSFPALLSIYLLSFCGTYTYGVGPVCVFGHCMCKYLIVNDQSIQVLRLPSGKVKMIYSLTAC